MALGHDNWYQSYSSPSMAESTDWYSWNYGIPPGVPPPNPTSNQGGFPTRFPSVPSWDPWRYGDPPPNPNSPQMEESSSVRDYWSYGGPPMNSSPSNRGIPTNFQIASSWNPWSYGIPPPNPFSAPESCSWDAPSASLSMAADRTQWFIEESTLLHVEQQRREDLQQRQHEEFLKDMQALRATTNRTLEKISEMFLKMHPPDGRGESVEYPDLETENSSGDTPRTDSLATTRGSCSSSSDSQWRDEIEDEALIKDPNQESEDSDTTIIEGDELKVEASMDDRETVELQKFRKKNETLDQVIENNPKQFQIQFAILKVIPRSSSLVKGSVLEGASKELCKLGKVSIDRSAHQVFEELSDKGVVHLVSVLMDGKVLSKSSIRGLISIRNCSRISCSYPFIFDPGGRKSSMKLDEIDFFGRQGEVGTCILYPGSSIYGLGCKIGKDRAINDFVSVDSFCDNSDVVYCGWMFTKDDTHSMPFDRGRVSISNEVIWSEFHLKWSISNTREFFFDLGGTGGSVMAVITSLIFEPEGRPVCFLVWLHDCGIGCLEMEVRLVSAMQFVFDPGGTQLKTVVSWRSVYLRCYCKSLLVSKYPCGWILKRFCTNELLHL